MGGVPSRSRQYSRRTRTQTYLSGADSAWWSAAAAAVAAAAATAASAVGAAVATVFVFAAAVAALAVVVVAVVVAAAAAVAATAVVVAVVAVLCAGSVVVWLVPMTADVVPADPADSVGGSLGSRAVGPPGAGGPPGSPSPPAGSAAARCGNHHHQLCSRTDAGGPWDPPSRRCRTRCRHQGASPSGTVQCMSET